MLGAAMVMNTCVTGPRVRETTRLPGARLEQEIRFTVTNACSDRWLPSVDQETLVRTLPLM